MESHSVRRKCLSGEGRPGRCSPTFLSVRRTGESTVWMGGLEINLGSCQKGEPFEKGPKGCEDRLVFSFTAKVKLGRGVRQKSPLGKPSKGVGQKSRTANFCEVREEVKPFFA